MNRSLTNAFAVVHRSLNCCRCNSLSERHPGIAEFSTVTIKCCHFDISRIHFNLPIPRVSFQIWKHFCFTPWNYTFIHVGKLVASWTVTSLRRGYLTPNLKHLSLIYTETISDAHSGLVSSVLLDPTIGPHSCSSKSHGVGQLQTGWLNWERLHTGSIWFDALQWKCFPNAHPT